MRRFSSAAIGLALALWAAPALADGIYGGGGGSGCSLAAPTAKVGLAAVNGTASTCMRSDAAPPLDQTISPTMTGNWVFTPASGAGPVINPVTNTTALTISSASHTGSDATSDISGTTTLNTTGSPSVITWNTTLTAAGTATKLIDLQVGGTTAFSVLPNVSAGRTDLHISSTVSGNNTARLLFDNAGVNVASIYADSGNLNVYVTTQDLFDANVSGMNFRVTNWFWAANNFESSLFNQGITADTGKIDATVCEDTTNHQFFSGTGAAGICLGTSSLRFKIPRGLEPDTLSGVMATPAVIYRNKPGYGDGGKRNMHWFYAEDVARTLPGCAAFDAEGRPSSIDMGCMVQALWRAVQEQQDEIVAMRNVR